MIKVSGLAKDFSYTTKEPGLLGSLKALFFREKKTKSALKNINLEIHEGEMIGLIGANGAGKTTLVKILAGIVHPSRGNVSILGHTPWERSDEYRRQMALIMGQKAQVWWDLPALDSFLLLKEIYQLSDEVYQYNIKYLSETLMISEQLKTPVRKLSLGERMKVELMAALLHNPKVIFLDEPTIGLDISAQKAVREFLKDYQKRFRPIIILTSHYMEDIKELCKRIVIIKDGEFVYDGELSRVQKMMGDEKVLTITTEKDFSDDDLKALGAKRKAENIFTVSIPRTNLSVMTAKIFSEFSVLDLNIQDPSIEDIIESMMRSDPK
jgi:ABC-2 type transport system ATP-binding protein